MVESANNEFLLSAATEAQEAKKNARKEKTLKRTVGGIFLVTVLGVLGSFGLIYAVLVIQLIIAKH